MAKLRRPPKPLSALCVLDDYVTSVHLGEGAWEHTSAGPKHDGPRVWPEVVDSGVDPLALEGLTQEWGLYDDLPKCVVAGEPLVEYGVVEHRYRDLNPNRYHFLLDRYGHTAIAPKNYTASSFIASALGRLWRRGELAATWLPATGRWSYNGTISYYGLPGVDIGAEPITWADFATAEGLDPDSWDL